MRHWTPGFHKSWSQVRIHSQHELQICQKCPTFSPFFSWKFSCSNRYVYSTGKCRTLMKVFQGTLLPQLHFISAFPILFSLRSHRTAPCQPMSSSTSGPLWITFKCHPLNIFLLSSQFLSVLLLFHKLISSRISYSFNLSFNSTFHKILGHYIPKINLRNLL